MSDHQSSASNPHLEPDSGGRAVEAIASGAMAVVVDDADRENEEHLIMAAEGATQEAEASMGR